MTFHSRRRLSHLACKPYGLEAEVEANCTERTNFILKKWENKSRESYQLELVDRQEKTPEHVTPLEMKWFC